MDWLHKEGTIEKDVPLYFQTETLPAGDYVFILAAARDDADIDLYVRQGKKPHAMFMIVVLSAVIVTNFVR